MSGTGIPLIDAALSYSVSDVQAILDSGADVNARDSRERTALIALMDDIYLSRVEPEAVEITKLLLDANADIYAKNKFGMDAMYLAANEGAVDIVLLLTGRGQRITDSISIHHFLAYSWPRHPSRHQRNQFTALLPLILEEKPDLEVRIDEYKQRTALIIACNEGNSTAIELLLKAGADPCAVSQYGSGPLELVCNYAWRARSECLGPIKQLIDGGAEINRCGNYEESMTPLIWTVIYGGNSIEVVKLLLDSGADPNIPSFDGTSPVEHAAKSKRPDLVELLYEYGAKRITNDIPNRDPS